MSCPEHHGSFQALGSAGRRQDSAPRPSPSLCKKPETQVLPTQRFAAPLCSEGLDLRCSGREFGVGRSRSSFPREPRPREKLSKHTFGSRRKAGHGVIRWLGDEPGISLGCRLSAPQLPRGGTLRGSPAPSSSSHVTLSHQGEQTAPCLAGWLPTLASRASVRASELRRPRPCWGRAEWGEGLPAAGVQPGGNLGGSWGSRQREPSGRSQRDVHRAGARGAYRWGPPVLMVSPELDPTPLLHSS